MTMKVRVFVVILVQTFVLVGMIAKRQLILEYGTSVLLQTQPVDPRSLFRGDYVRFHYAIGDLDLESLAGDDEFRRHERVYVVLKPAVPYWKPVSIYHDRPQLSGSQVVIRGEVKWQTRQRYDPKTRTQKTVNRLSVRYGIESYFVPEGEGRRLERPADGQEIAVQIAVDRRGNSAIEALLVNDKELYREGLL